MTLYDVTKLHSTTTQQRHVPEQRLAGSSGSGSGRGFDALLGANIRVTSHGSGFFSLQWHCFGVAGWVGGVASDEGVWGRDRLAFVDGNYLQARSSVCGEQPLYEAVVSLQAYIVSIPSRVYVVDVVSSWL